MPFRVMGMTDATALLNTLLAKKDLSREEARSFLDAVILGGMTPAQIGAILVALRAKGEVASEVLGLLESMREHMQKIEAPGAIDIVGTGGDGSGTFNISTASAFVASGAGAKVAKHGNRAASSKCGSADVLEALGVNIQLTPEQAKKVYDAAGIVFLFAPIYHAALKNVVAVRKELKIRTIFNVLGPFANPASTRRQLVGVPNKGIAKTMAAVIPKLGYERILLVTSEDGMDEISLSSKTHAVEYKGGKSRKFSIEPSKFGFKRAVQGELVGADAQQNATIIRDILDGKKDAKRDITVLNAAFALYIAGIAKTPNEGVILAEKSIDSGAARAALDLLVKESNKFVKGV